MVFAWKICDKRADRKSYSICDSCEYFNTVLLNLAVYVHIYLIFPVQSVAIFDANRYPANFIWHVARDALQYDEQITTDAAKM